MALLFSFQLTSKCFTFTIAWLQTNSYSVYGLHMFLSKLANSDCKGVIVGLRFDSSQCNCNVDLEEEDLIVLNAVAPNHNTLTRNCLCGPKICAKMSSGPVLDDTDSGMAASNSLIFYTFKLNSCKLNNLNTSIMTEIMKYKLKNLSYKYND